MAYVTGHNYAETIDAADGVTNGNDSIHGFDGDDIIYGLGGDDSLSGNEGADTLNGGAGSDTAYYLQSTEAVVVSLASGRGYGGDAQGDRYIDIENVLGSEYNDLITGNAADNRLMGDAGNDTLDGGAGNDALYGNNGNDTLKGGGGADDLYGDTGIDTVSYDASSAGVFVSLYDNAAGGGDAEGDWFNSIENVTGSAHADDLWGDNGANTLKGLDGNDTLKG